MPIPVIERIRHLLGEGDLDGACLLLMDDLSRQGAGTLENDCLLFSSRLNSLRRRERQGLVTREEAAVEQNTLTHSLLFILKEFERKLGSQVPPSNAPVAQATRWFEQVPFPWDRAESMELYRLLTSVYTSVDELRMLAKSVPIHLLEWKTDTVGQAWRSLIDLASQQGKMGLLLDRVLQDEVGAIHPALRKLMESRGA